MAFKNKSMTIGAAIFCLGTLVPAVTGAYAISPMEIYRQARQQNEVFLQKLSRYRNAFDMQDKDGNTAYCIALRYNDVSAQEILEKYGADTGHSCVESIEREKAEKARRAERNAAAKRRRFRSSEGVLAPTSNPYLAMNEAYGAENMLKLSDTSRLKLSLQTGENGLYERDYEQDNHSFTERSYAFSGEYSFNMTDYLEIATLGGMLMENDALLGMNGTGGFGIKDSSTYYMGLRAALNLTPNLSLVAAYYRGYTQGADTPMLAISDLQTESFMLAGEYRLNATDKVGISLSSPLSVVKGRASLLYANGRDNNSDTIYLNKLTTSLTPEAKEYDLGLYYQGQPKEDLSLTGKVQARFNADGEKGVTDYIGIVGVQSAF